jgi:hypothetical protein
MRSQSSVSGRARGAALLHRIASKGMARKAEAPPGFEPGMADLQSAAGVPQLSTEAASCGESALPRCPQWCRAFRPLPQIPRQILLRSRVLGPPSRRLIKTGIFAMIKAAEGSHGHDTACEQAGNQGPRPSFASRLRCNKQQGPCGRGLWGLKAGCARSYDRVLSRLRIWHANCGLWINADSAADRGRASPIGWD